MNGPVFRKQIRMTKVELYLDGVLFATDSAAPFSFTWDTTQASEELHTLKAVAYDAANNYAASPVVTVAVQNQAADATPPITDFADPSDGAAVTKMVKVKIRAQDNVQVKQVEFYVDGALTSAASVSGDTVEVQFTLNTRKLAKGAHSLSARALDAAGNQGASLPVVVTVK